MLFLVVLLSPKLYNDLQYFNQNTRFSENDSSLLFLTGQKLREAPDLNLLQGNSIISFSPPQFVTPQVLGALASGTEWTEESKEVIEHIVESGDNLWQIAREYNISLDTILWANDLNENSVLLVGQKLVILPVSGVIYHVKTGDTLSQISETYKADLKEVITFNNLSSEGDIFIGDILIIPDGVMPVSSPQYASAWVPIANSYFICPIPSPCRITQGLHWYNAIDFSNDKCGEPVFAAAGGEIQKIGYHSIWGQYIRILHPNGVVTFYGHLSKILTSPGIKVSQGQIIGYTGYTGFTIPSGPAGCHLHFDVRGAKNPFAR